MGEGGLVLQPLNPPRSYRLRYECNEETEFVIVCMIHLFSTDFNIHSWITGFVEEPTMPENVTLGSIAKLRCIHETAFSIIWNISLNGAIINPTHNEDFTPGFEQSDRGLLYTLSVLALPQYNGTLITCIAVLPNELSRTIMLVIHGKD